MRNLLYKFFWGLGGFFSYIDPSKHRNIWLDLPSDAFYKLSTHRWHQDELGICQRYNVGVSKWLTLRCSFIPSLLKTYWYLDNNFYAVTTIPWLYKGLKYDSANHVDMPGYSTLSVDDGGNVIHRQAEKAKEVNKTEIWSIITIWNKRIWHHNGRNYKRIPDNSGSTLVGPNRYTMHV